MQLGKTVHTAVATGSVTSRMNNVFAFGTIPGSLVIWLQDVDSELGNRSSSKFGYQDRKVERIQIFKNGAPISSCSEMLHMDTEKRNSHTHVLLYKSMLRVFGKEATCISMDDFTNAFFLYCVNLAPNPRVGDDYGVTRLASDRKLSFIEAATIDIEIRFKKPTEIPLYAMFMGIFDVSVNLNELGLQHQQE